MHPSEVGPQVEYQKQRKKEQEGTPPRKSHSVSPARKSAVHNHKVKGGVMPEVRASNRRLIPHPDESPSPERVSSLQDQLHEVPVKGAS